MEFEYKGNLYYIDKNSNDTDNMFFDKCWYIIKHEPNNNKELIHLQKKAELWYNSKSLNCKYIEDNQNSIE